MDTFQHAMSLLMSPQCYEDIFVKLNLTNVVCLKMIVSKCLGYAILAGSLLLRLPQILKIVSAKSGAGISAMSEILMLFSIFGTMSYGYFKQFPVSAYGDAFSLWVQANLVLMCVFYYDKKHCSAVLTLLCSSVASYLMYADLIPEAVIVGLNGSGLLLAAVSKLTQIWANYQNASTGVLSAITLLLQFLGCVARIFTSIQETGDLLMIVTYVTISVLNGLLVFQLAYYWNSEIKKPKKD